VVIIGEDRAEPGLLATAQQRQPGSKGAPHPVERITAAATMTLSLLLNALAAQIQLGAGQGNDVEGIMPISA